MLQVQGKIIDVCEIVSGTSKGGKEWQKKEFIIETNDQYPKKICFTLFGDKTDLISIVNQGQDATVTFDIESREFNGKWFHNINAFGVKLDGKSESDSTSYPQMQIEKTETSKSVNTGDADDIPF